MSCSSLDAAGFPVACSVDTDCGAGQACGYFFSVGPDPWLEDPFSGVLYPDTNPGDGDGYFDLVTGSTDDNCVGEFEVASLAGDDSGDQVVASDFVFLQRPDEVTDLYLQNPFWGDIFPTDHFEDQTFVESISSSI